MHTSKLIFSLLCLPLLFLACSGGNVNYQREVVLYLPAAPSQQLADVVTAAVDLYIKEDPAGGDTSILPRITLVALTADGPVKRPLFTGISVGVTSDPNNVNVLRTQLEEWHAKADFFTALGSHTYLSGAAADSLLQASAKQLPNHLALPINDSTNYRALLTSELSAHLLSAPSSDKPIHILVNNLPPPVVVPNFVSRTRPARFQNQGELPFSIAELDLLLESSNDPWRIYARKAEVLADGGSNRRTVENYRLAVRYALARGEEQLLLDDLYRLTPSQRRVRDAMPQHFKAIFRAIETRDAAVADIVPYYGYKSRNVGYRLVHLLTNHEDYWYPAANIGLFALRNIDGTVTVRLTFVNSALGYNEEISLQPGTTTTVNYTDGGKRRHLRIINDSNFKSRNIVSLHLRPRPGYSAAAPNAK